MKKAKQFILVSVILGGLFFLFGLEVIPENFQPQEILDIAADSDVIIIFNSGGWGDTPFEKAEDFAPIVEGIRLTLNEWGYDSVVIPYQRTKNTLSGKIVSAKDFLNFFNSSSDTLAKDLEFLAENLPDKKIIVAGLSSGGAFVEKTMEKLSGEVRDSVYGIEAGVPFWHQTLQSENILQLPERSEGWRRTNVLRLTNSGKDSLSAGEVKALLFSLVKAPFRWIFSKINGQNLPLALSFQAPGHEYLWDLPEVGPKIISFLEEKFR